MVAVETYSAEDTHRLGEELAQWVSPGDVISLIGELGAGKTHLVKGIVAGLGVPSEAANSPTFVVIQEYDGRIPVCHIDAYRLRDVDEFLELGADEILASDAVCLIEWADRVEDVLPRDRLDVRIETTGETTRRFTFAATGPRSQKIQQAVTAHCVKTR